MRITLSDDQVYGLVSDQIADFVERGESFTSFQVTNTLRDRNAGVEVNRFRVYDVVREIGLQLVSDGVVTCEVRDYSGHPAYTYVPVHKDVYSGILGEAESVDFGYKSLPLKDRESQDPSLSPRVVYFLFD